jgi:hypothetical protein
VLTAAACSHATSGTVRSFSADAAGAGAPDAASSSAAAPSGPTANRADAALLDGGAQRVADIIRIEDELSQREAALESLQARQRALAQETQLATITLQLVTAAPRKAGAHHQRARHDGGFVGGLQRGWRGFTTAAGWLAAALGTVLPFLAVLLVLAAAARAARGRHKPARTAPE